jgi:Arc/MetJ family transcription regulator
VYELDEKLVDEAMKLTHKKTKKELVNYALRELVSKMKRKQLLEIEGKVEWTGDLGEMRKSRV